MRLRSFASVLFVVGMTLPASGETFPTYLDAGKIRGKSRDAVTKMVSADRRWISVKYDASEETLDLKASDGTSGFIAFTQGTPHNLSLNLHRSVALSPALLNVFGLNPPPPNYKTNMSLVWKGGFSGYKEATIMTGGGGNTIIMLFIKTPTD